MGALAPIRVEGARWCRRVATEIGAHYLQSVQIVREYNRSQCTDRILIIKDCSLWQIFNIAVLIFPPCSLLIKLDDTAQSSSYHTPYKRIKDFIERSLGIFRVGRTGQIQAVSEWPLKVGWSLIPNSGTTLIPNWTKLRSNSALVCDLKRERQRRRASRLLKNCILGHYYWVLGGSERQIISKCWKRPKKDWCVEHWSHPFQHNECAK